MRNMNQILSFMEKLIDKVMSGEKDLTTRIWTPYRDKLEVGNIAYIYTGIRTPKARKWGEAEIVWRLIWNQADLNRDFFNNIQKDEINDKLFYRREGFDSWDDFLKFFTQDEYKDEDLITYEFKLVPTLDEFL